MAKNFNGGIIIIDLTNVVFTEGVGADNMVTLYNQETDESYQLGETYHRLLQAKNQKVAYVKMDGVIRCMSIVDDTEDDEFNLYDGLGYLTFASDGEIVEVKLKDVIDEKANSSDVYTKTQVDNKLADKLDKHGADGGSISYDGNGFVVINGGDVDFVVEDDNVFHGGDIVIDSGNIHEYASPVNPIDLSNIEETFALNPTGHQLPNTNLSNLTAEQMATIRNNMLYWIRQGYVKLDPTVYRITKYVFDGNNVEIGFGYAQFRNGEIYEYDSYRVTLNDDTNSYTYNYDAM